MSFRIPTPVSKLMARSISSTAQVARPTNLLNNGSKTAAGSRKRQPKAKKVAEDADAAEYSTKSTTTPHRPHLPQVQRTGRTNIPLMQGFRTSAPKPTRLDTSTIDFAYLPNLHLEAASQPDPWMNIRVPLLPDNDSPAPGFRKPEQTDAPLARPEISVVAANPEQVYPASALTEVEGMGVDGVELKFVRNLHDSTSNDLGLGGQGMIKDLWKGLVDDLGFGANGKQKPA
ncbi:hypothetical protein B0H66DRAFT_550878 [Apodospora peruviana]|uniref:Uncharacterized protein n=1 Tax=Apodospora peruviana TaxID=516989 RepID=A0AAE0IJR2_9PEZI|nr:hypothetical protein B0H66DRAFT_550878 [Apodospora peruviana]